MTLQTTHAIMPYLMLAELGAAVLGASAASAEERITLEVIGAVRMAGAEEARRADGAPQQAEVRQAREMAAGSTDARMVSRRN